MEQEILTLRKNMKNNQIYLDNMKKGLIENQKGKETLTKKFTKYMNYFNVQDLQHICQTLTQDKLKLYT